MAFEIRRAERRRARARVGIDGPAGAGKTHGALLFAAGLAPGGRIVVIDTEHGSAEMEAGKANIPPFDVCPLEAPYSPKRYVEAIHACEAAGADVLIIDSLSHAWSGTGGALDQVDRIAGSGNRFTAWRDVTPQHNALVDAILQSPCHVIVTMRTKMEYALETDGNGKTKVKKLGMAPIQREGMEYEMSVVFDVEQERHLARATKDRTSLFDGAPPDIITPAHGARFREWLESGAPVPPKATTGSGDGRRVRMLTRIVEMEEAVGSDIAEHLASECGVTVLDAASDEELATYGKRLRAAVDARSSAQVGA
ncbi:MAG: ATP-binding protein [Bradyrhizobium sp.]|uniref:ATP-binding protein n=1 Tax=Bradyrhizobium sp. TaxID=376 RepID=UPI003D0B6FAF